MKHTKQSITEYVYPDGEPNVKRLSRAVVAIYEQQTAEEQVCGETVEDNGMGFNGADANSLTKQALKIQQYGAVADWNVEWVAKKMKKYCGQLAKLANLKEQANA